MVNVLYIILNERFLQNERKSSSPVNVDSSQIFGSHLLRLRRTRMFHYKEQVQFQWANDSQTAQKAYISANNNKCASNNHWGCCEAVNHVDSIPGETVHRCPVFSVRETELRNDFQLVFSLSHKLEASFKLMRKKNQEHRCTNVSCWSFKPK